MTGVMCGRKAEPCFSELLEQHANMAVFRRGRPAAPGCIARQIAVYLKLKKAPFSFCGGARHRTDHAPITHPEKPEHRL
jgi:hypothetical protein